MNEIKRHFNILKAVAFVTYKEWSAYRTHSMVSILVGPVYFAVQYFIWQAVYSNSTSIYGMDFEQMVRYFGITVLIGYLTMDFADWNLTMLVNSGKFLTFALRPINHRFFALSQKIGHRVLGLIFEFIPCLLIFIFIFKINMKPANLPLFIISVIFAYLINFYVNYCLGLLAFWLVQSSGIKSVFSMAASVFSGALIPLVFFPKSLQLIQFFLPFQYITYVPASVYTGSFSLGGLQLSLTNIVLIQGFVALCTYLISVFLYNKAMKQFTGVGG